MNAVLDVKMIELHDDHWYKVTLDDGKVDYIPSVTTKLGIIEKPSLARWRGDVGNREADLRMFEGQQAGRRIHHAWYTYTTGGVVLYQPAVNPIYTDAQIKDLQMRFDNNVFLMRYQDEMFDLYKLQKWFGLVNPKVLASEATCVSLKDRDAGTIDNVFEIAAGDYMVNGAKPLHLEGGIYVADLKSGNVVSDEAKLQTAAYANAWEQMGRGKVAGTLILHTSAKTRGGIRGLATILRTEKEWREEDLPQYRLASKLWELRNADKRPEIFEFPNIISQKEISHEAAQA
jgi:hypothetical protein